MLERSTKATVLGNPVMPHFVADALAYSIEKIRHTLAMVNSFPEYTEGDSWICGDDGGWTGGHWTGLLWLAYAQTSDKSLKEAAIEWTTQLAPRQYDSTTHDLGFLFELSYILGEKLIGDSDLKAPAIQAARTLIQRFNPRGSFIQAWGSLDGPVDERGRTIIDAMMNLNLLFWAAKEIGDSRFADIAVAHAQTVLQYQMRADGSTSHTIEFNPDTGEFIRQETHQGLKADSCWARGQSWAVYGFTVCYRETGDSSFLEAARKLANYCVSHLPPDHVPYWDYDSPLIPNDVRDSSAAAILASGLLMLAALESEPANAQHWGSEALIILESLWGNYSSRGRQEPSILIHATRHKPYGSMDHGLIYGDYYFVEALRRLL